MVRLTAILCLTIATLSLVATPGKSDDLYKIQTPPSAEKIPEVMIEDGVRMILKALQLILKSIPQYKSPEILENGDIIIRRIPSNEKTLKSRGQNQKET